MRLNIGCGDVVPAGWVNIDREPYPTWPGGPDSDRDAQPIRYRLSGHVEPVDGDTFRCDVSLGLPFYDETFDGAVAHHVLQMVAQPDLVAWLTEIRRVLKLGGWLRLTVPDLLGAVTAHGDGCDDWFPIADSLESSIGGKLCVYLSQCGATRSVFTVEWLSELCWRAGFGAIHGATSALDRNQVTFGPDWLTALDSRLDESIVVECQR